MTLTPDQVRAIMRALQMSQSLITGIADTERSDRPARHGAGCKAENAVFKAQKILEVQS